MPDKLVTALLALLLVPVAPLAWQGGRWLYSAGLFPAAGSPLAFMVHHQLRPAGLARHPLLVSAVSGLGCAMIMVAEQRFGTHLSWALYPAAGALLTWMLWQRWRRSPSA